MPALIASRRALLTPKKKPVVVVAPAIPAGLTGVGFFSEDFSSYANDSALKTGGNCTFLTTSGTYGTLDTNTGHKYNGHNTFNDISPADRSSSGIASKVPSGGFEAVTYRTTIQWRSGVDYSLGRTLMVLFPKDTSLFQNTYIAQLSINGSGQYLLALQLYNASSSSIMSAPGSTVLGSMGAEVTSGYVIDYFLRYEKIDTTHIRCTVWLAKNVGGIVGTPMLVGSAITKTLTAAQSALYQGKFYPDSDGNSQQPAYSVSTALGIAQFEAIDETAHPDVFGLASAVAYTPLT